MEEGKRERGKVWKDGMEGDKVIKDSKGLTRCMGRRNRKEETYKEEPNCGI